MIVMKLFRSLLCLLLLLALLMPASWAAAAKKKASPTPTPPPVEIDPEIAEPPAVIRTVLDLAWQEWDTLRGKRLGKSNKYTKWWNNYEWEWCAGFVTWCMLEAGVPQDYEDAILAQPEGSVTGIYHCKGSSPSKLIHAYLHMHRTTMIPQKGYIVLYGEESNRWIHVGIVWDVEKLDNGKYRLTTIEGNMSNTVKMYIYDYDAEKDYSIKNKYPDNSNVSAVPQEERMGETSKYRTYDLHQKGKDKKKPWYITCFLMPWIPGETEPAE